MNKRIALLYLIIILAFSLQAYAAENPLCCITANSCSENIDDCSELNGQDFAATDPYQPGLSDLNCRDIYVCDAGCIFENGVNKSTYRLNHDPAEFYYKGIFGTVPNCINPLDACEEGSCTGEPCSCGGQNTAEGEYCGNNNVTYYLESDCVNSYREGTEEYSFDFIVSSERKNEPLYGSEVRILSVTYQGSSTPELYDSYDFTKEDSTGKARAIFQFSFIKPITSISYQVSKNGYEIMFDTYDIDDPADKEYEITVKLPDAVQCEDGDEIKIKQNGCTYIKECVYDQKTGDYVWDDELKEEDPDCEGAEKEFCKEERNGRHILDYYLGEECVPDCETGDPDCCNVGEYCDECRCEEVGVGGCNPNGILEDSEICDINLFNSLGDDKSSAFNPNYIDYIEGMECDNKCIAIAPNVCGNGQYDPGESCEFMPDGSLRLDLGNNLPRCGVEYCIPEGEAGECTCRVEAYCGNGILEGAEECDWGEPWDRSNGEGMCLSSNCNRGTCECAPPECPSKDSIKLYVNNSLSREVTIDINISYCNYANISNLSIIYYQADENNNPISELEYEELLIPRAQFESDDEQEGKLLSYNFEQVSSSTTYLEVSSLLGNLNIETPAKYCFYAYSKYDTQEFSYLLEDFYADEIVCLDFGDYLCNFYKGQEFCHNNQPMHCIDPNGQKLDNLSAPCTSDEKCVVGKDEEGNNEAECRPVLPDNKCQSECGGLFGMFSFDNNDDVMNSLTVLRNNQEQVFECFNQLLFNPESFGYCYIDRSSTPVDQFDSCSKIQTCYDYDSSFACEQDVCLASALNCTWKPLPDHTELGEGVCVPEAYFEQDCTKCNDNTMNNRLLSYCDRNTCPTYGENCFFRADQYSGAFSVLPSITEITPEGCSDKNDLGCNFLNIKDDCINFDGTGERNLTLDEFYRRSPSNDGIGAETCRWHEATNKCYKDADDNNEDDCADLLLEPTEYERCVTDNEPPRTTIQLDDYMSGNFERKISIIDNEYDFLDGDLEMYYKILPEGSVFNNSDMKLAQIDNGTWIAYDNRTKGNYTLYYYSSDKANNVEEIKAFPFYMDTEKPNVTLDVDIQYILENDYATETEIVLLGDLNITTTVIDDPVKKVNCSLQLYNIDDEDSANHKEIFPEQMSIIDRGYSYRSPNASQKINQFYPRMEAGEYLFNLTCYDFVGNRRNIEKPITITDELISNFDPNSTIAEFPDRVNFTTRFDAKCLITTQEGRRYHYGNLTSEYSGLALHEADTSAFKKDHYLTWDSITDKFGDYLYNESIVTVKYYVKCVFDDSEYDLDMVYGGNNGHYIKFAVDRDAPDLVYLYTDEDGDYLPMNKEFWAHDMNLTIYSLDKKIYDSIGNSWEAGSENLDLKIKYRPTRDSNYPSSYITGGNINYETCGNPLEAYTNRDQVCTEDLYSELSNSGFYQFEISTKDKVGNELPESFELQVDNHDITFDILLDGASSGMLQRKYYDMELMPSKDVDDIREDLDPDYNMTIVSVKIYANRTYMMQPLKTLQAYFNESTNNFDSYIDVRDYEFNGLNGEGLIFVVHAVDSHGIEVKHQISRFFADTTPPEKFELKPLFDDANEVQYVDSNGNDYPLFHYEGRYYTNQDSLLITGTSDDDAKVIFSWNKPYGENASYDLSQNNEEELLFEIELEPLYNNFSMTSKEVYIKGDSSEQILLTNYLEFTNTKRDTYGNYGKRFAISSIQEDNNAHAYRRIILKEPLEMKKVSSNTIKIYDEQVSRDWFGYDLPIPEGCNDLYIRAVDQNLNIKLGGKFEVCKDQEIPKLDHEKLSPKPDSLNANIYKSIKISVSDDSPLTPFSKLLTQQGDKYGPKLYRNGELMKGYEIQTDDGYSYDLIAKSKGIQGEFNMTFITYDYAHNVLNYSWFFIIDKNLPEDPHLDFDKGFVRSTEDNDVYFLNMIPSIMYLNFTKKENKTITIINVDGNDLIDSPVSNIFESFNVSLSPVSFELDQEYPASFDLVKHTTDLGDIILGSPYRKTLVLDTQPPSVELSYPDRNLIGTDYINEEEFNIWFNVTDDNYAPHKARIIFERLEPTERIVVTDNCFKKHEALYQCKYPLKLEGLVDKTTLDYYFTVEDMAGNVGLSDNYSIYVDREIPQFTYYINDTSNVLKISDNTANYDYLTYPLRYDMIVYSSKKINFTDNPQVVYEAITSDGRNYTGVISSEDVNGANNSFSFVFNISKHKNVLNPINDIVGEINFYFRGTDTSGNYFEKVKMDYNSNSYLWIYSKNPEKPILEPLFDYPGNGLDEGAQFFDHDGEEYPLTYYDDVFYSNENDVLYVTGFTEDISNKVSLIWKEKELELDSYITSKAESLDYSDALVNEDYPGGDKNTTSFVLNSNYDIDTDSNYVCVFFDNHVRKKFGHYKQGYHITSTEKVDGLTKINIEDPLEVDVFNSEMKFYKGEDCKNNDNFFKMEIDMTQFSEEKVNLKIQHENTFNQIRVYNLGFFQKDTTKPQLKLKKPDYDEIIVDKNLNLSFIICDNSPGILGSKNYFTNLTKGNKEDFYIKLDNQYIVLGYVSPIYEVDDLYCYNFTQKNENKFTEGKHRIDIYSVDYAHNEFKGNYNFIVDPDSPRLKSFELSESSGRVYEYNINDKFYYIKFTRNDTPNLYINFSDNQKVDFYEVNFFYNDFDTMNPINIFRDNLDVLKDEELAHFRCDRKTELGINFFNCTISEKLLLDRIYQLAFKMNKTIEKDGKIKNKISPAFIKEYFVFDNELRYDQNFDYSNPSPSRNINFRITSQEFFGLLPVMTIKDIYGQNRDFNLSGSHNLNSLTTWKTDLYGGEFMDEEGGTYFPSGNYTFNLRIEDYAGNSRQYSNWITIDDETPSLRLTSFRAERFKQEDVTSKESLAYDKRLIFKKPKVIIEGVITEDTTRKFIDTDTIIFKLGRNEDPDDLQSYFYINKCEKDKCDFSKKTDNPNIEGCICEETGIFNVTISDEAIPFEYNTVINSYLDIIPFDDAGNKKNYKAFMLRDFEPPKRPSIDIE